MQLGTKQVQTFLNRLLVQGQYRQMSGAAASIRSRFEDAYVTRMEGIRSKKAAP